MTTSPQTATLLPMTVPFSESLSETWLLERTYHAHLWSGKELSVPDLTLAMKQLNDFDGHHPESCVKTSSNQVSTDAKPVPPLSRI